MRYLTKEKILKLYTAIIEQTGGSRGIRDVGALESALAQPFMAFGGQDLYPTLVEKAAVLGYSLIQNHPFLDGNKRIGHAAMEVFLLLNDYEIEAPVDEQELLILDLAAGKLSRQHLVEWLAEHIVPYKHS